MSTTLTYGYKKPQNGDDSSQWFSDIAEDIQLVNDHTHNGVNSSQLSTGAIEKEAVVTKSVSDWVGASAPYTVAISSSEVPAVFQSASKFSSETCNVIIMEDDSATNNYFERIYLKYTWSGAKGSQALTLTSNTKVAIKVLFV